MNLQHLAVRLPEFLLCGHACLAALGLALLSAGPVQAAEAPRLVELRTQQTHGTTYFQVRFENPPDLCLPTVPVYREWPYWRAGQICRPELSRLPRLVPQDQKTKAVYLRLTYVPRKDRGPDSFLTLGTLKNEGLDFVGRLEGKGEARFLLLYPTREEGKGRANEPKYAAALRRRGSWAEVPVTLNFSQAKKAALPDSAGNRDPGEAPSPDDLEGQWAAGQANQFSVLEAQAPEFGFYGFAREATGRKYRVPTVSLSPAVRTSRGDDFHRRLYETTTGAAAIAESLALHRMLHGDFRDDGARTIPVANLPGIDIAEHPWAKMMGGKKPSPEPLARLVPYDNYYVHFKNIAKFIEWGELMDQWGTTLSRAYEVNSRDYQLKERLEQQLCLRSSALGKTLGPLVVNGLAITGSDGYLREGSDVTVIFHVRNRPLFLAAVEPYLQEARRKYGDRLRAGKSSYHKILIESYVTHLREVSLHRASFGDFVAYSNSPAGLRRVLDTYQGRHRALADSPDFQYMRTVFRLEDKQEDGFLFFSDAFIRQLVGPASKIKEKRRLEALTSLYMLTHGAMFVGWETGKLPANHPALLKTSGLREEELYVPEGKGVRWDPARNLAVSDVYNTIHFATPLIEIPIDRVTPTEEQQYREFREGYLRQWRKYFDPVGIRLALREKQVRAEVYILPLINASQYRWLRDFTGGGTITLHPGQASPHALVEFRAHIAPQIRRQLNGLGDGRGENRGWLGDWFLVRLDDSSAYAKLAETWASMEIDPEPSSREDGWRNLFKCPLSVGVGIKDRKAATRILETIVGGSEKWEAIKPPYRGVTISRYRGNNEPRVLYSALMEDACYLSLSKTSLKDLIDRSRDRKQEKKGDKGQAVQVNASLYLAPKAARQARGFLRFYLEWETHRRALANAPLWHALYRCGIVKPDAPEAAARAAAKNFIGFLPVSADDAVYQYEPRTDEVVNARHGSLRKPRLHEGVEPGSPLGRLLEQFRTIRADLTFREDGVQTVVTFERGNP